MNPLRKTLILGGVAASSLLGGAVGASFLGTAHAADTTTTTAAPADSNAPANPPASPPAGAPAPGPHQANGKTETVLTGSDADKATAAALQASPGATIVRLETDADGGTYEAHITKADGTPATVKMDGNFNVVGVEDGGPGGHRGGPCGQPPAPATTPSTPAQ